MEQAEFLVMEPTIVKENDCSLSEKCPSTSNETELSCALVDNASESTPTVDDLNKPIEASTDVEINFCNNEMQLSLKEKLEEERKLKLQEEREKRKQAEDEYNRELSEQRYKRLMHLLDKSQFYANLIKGKKDVPSKLSQSTSTAKLPLKKNLSKETKSTKRKSTNVLDENSPPLKRSRRNVRPREEHDLKDFVTSKSTRKLRDRKSLKKSYVDQINDDEEKDVILNFNQKEILDNEDVEFLNPKYFVGELRDYQIDGLKWLKVLHENGLNGILADEMGLGKTIQVIALFCDLIERRQSGPFLVVAPLSTIPNWLLEFEKFAPSLPVVLLHGDPEEKLKSQRKIKQKYLIESGYKSQPIVITTYDVTLREKRFLQSQKWRYIVIDEGHRIKNPECQLVKVLKTLKSMNRLLLTGTPLQNDLSELWSLLHFLLPEIFNDLAVFESWFDVKELLNEQGTMKFLQQEEEKKVVASLREILKPFMLRRIKTDVCLEIPTKKEIIVYAPLTELQRDLYKAVLNRDLQTLCKIESAPLIVDDTNGQRPKRQCVLRKNCDQLYYNALQGNAIDEYFGDSMSSFESKSSAEWELGRSNTSLLNNIIEPQVQNLTLNNISKLDENDLKESDLTTSLSKDQASEQQNLAMWKQYTDVTERNREFFIHITFGSRLPMYKKIVNHPFLMHCPLGHDGLPLIDDDLIKASGKLMVLDQMLVKLKEGNHKILLFSTWTKILDILEDYLSMRNYLYVRLDGATKIEKRKEDINLFNDDPNVFLYLISTRAGGVGLNLAGADTVIIYDSDWNPQVDIQAMARCHRIGQTKPVAVYKFCTKGTIDEAIIDRAEAKRKLEKMVISKKDIGSNLNNKETLLKLKQLLESKDCQVVSSEKNDVFTEEELEKLLDRSDLIQEQEIVNISSQERKPLVPSTLDNSQ